MTTTRLLSIVLQREDCNVPWGFRLTGGGDKVTSPPVSISRVCPGTLASRHLAPGDVVLAVQGRSTRGLNASEVDSMIASSGNTLQLIIQEAEVDDRPQSEEGPPTPTLYVTCEEAAGGGGAMAPEIHVSAGPQVCDMSGGIRVYPQMYTAVETRVDEKEEVRKGESYQVPQGLQNRQPTKVVHSPVSPTSPPPFAIKVTMTMMPMEYEEEYEEEEEEDPGKVAGAARKGEKLPRSIWSYDDMEAAAQDGMDRVPPAGAPSPPQTLG